MSISTPVRWSLHHDPRAHQAGNPSVLIIGAGMAGLVTARILHDSGFAVTVFEARGRLGGRIWTDDALGVPSDLGASWIHCADDNPLTCWAERIGLPLIYTPTGVRRFYLDGTFRHQQQVVRQAWRGIGATALRVSVYTARSHLRRRGRRAISLAQAVGPLLENPHLSLADRRLLGWIIAVSEGVQGAPSEDIDLEAWYPSEATGVNAMPLGGYRRLVEDVATGLDIRLNTPVGIIVHGNDDVTLHTQAGPMRGDAVVVTVPLSILKSGQLLFYPPLDPAKQAAIQRIGYGGDAVLNKIFLRFPFRFWPDMQDRCVALPVSPEQRGYFNNWCNLEPLVQQPVLIGFASGRAAAYLDRHMPDAEIVDTAMAAVRRMFGPAIPNPVAFHLTRWLSDPWALGSYSYAHVNSPPSDRDLYAAPVADRVFFAGEGTMARDYGTVHAALLSGERAAREIHRRYCCSTESLDSLPYAAWRHKVLRNRGWIRR